MKGFESGFGRRDSSAEDEARAIKDRVEEAADRFRSDRDRELAPGLGIEAWRDKLIAEGRVPKQELLDLMSDLALEINAVHLDGYFSLEEAKAMLEILQDSKGRDNALTMGLLETVLERKWTKRLDEREGKA